MKILGLLFSLILLCTGSLVALKKKDPKTAETYSVVAGTVFRESGFALPGAEVTISPAEEDVASKRAKKSALLADARGEFAFHMPPVKSNYTVVAAAKGFKTQQKAIEVLPGVRVDVTFTLAAESK